jgi:hypothetical protein
MRYARGLLIVAIAAAGLLGCNDNDPTGPEPPAGEEFDWRGIIAQGDRIEIKNINGDVRASFTSGSEVVVLATKTGQESDPTSVTIEVVQHAEGVTICAVYPDVPGMEPNECLPGLPGNMSNGDNDVEVEFTVWVPAGVEFVGRVIGGDVEATGIQSDVFVVTMGGNVTVTTTGIAEVTSTFGSMNVAIGRADPGRDLEFRSMSGDVTVEVPSNTNADVLASTSTGTIVSDFPLEGTGTTRSGTLGNGGPNLTLSTMNGNVNLREGPAEQL